MRRQVRATTSSKEPDERESNDANTRGSGNNSSSNSSGGSGAVAALSTSRGCRSTLALLSLTVAASLAVAFLLSNPTYSSIERESALVAVARTKAKEEDPNDPAEMSNDVAHTGTAPVVGITNPPNSRTMASSPLDDAVKDGAVEVVATAASASAVAMDTSDASTIPPLAENATVFDTAATVHKDSANEETIAVDSSTSASAESNNRDATMATDATVIATEQNWRVVGGNNVGQSHE